MKTSPFIKEIYLTLQGISVLRETCKNCFSSLFANRAISYRVDTGFDHFKAALRIGVRRMGAFGSRLLRRSFFSLL